jgi:phosphate transport system protein
MAPTFFNAVRAEVLLHFGDGGASPMTAVSRVGAMATGGRPQYVRQLDGLRDAILGLGSMADKALDRAGDALVRRDVILARSVERDDRVLNRQRLEIEEAAHLLLATQQPTAGDLRFLTAVLHIATDLERIGDHARSVAHLTAKLALAQTATGEPLVAAAGPVPEIPALVALVRTHLRGALDAFLERDPHLARRVAAEDADVDRLQDAAYDRLIRGLKGPPPPHGESGAAEAATYLLWIAHNLERSGDHVTNICERIIFAATARIEELDEVAEA